MILCAKFCDQSTPHRMARLVLAWELLAFARTLPALEHFLFGNGTGSIARAGCSLLIMLPLLTATGYYHEWLRSPRGAEAIGRMSPASVRWLWAVCFLLLLVPSIATGLGGWMRQ